MNRFSGFGLIGFLVLWQAVTFFGWISPVFLVSPVSIGGRLIEFFLDEAIGLDVFFSVLRTLGAFCLAVLIATPLGLVVGHFFRESPFLESVFDFFRSIPPIAFFPLFILLFGIDDLVKIAIGFFSASLVIFVSGVSGVKNGHQMRFWIAKRWGFSGFDFFWRILLPESLPSLFLGYRVAISLCFILVMVSEIFLGGSFGLGVALLDAQYRFDVAGLYAVIFLAGVIGFLFNFFITVLEKRLVHWQGK